MKKILIVLSLLSGYSLINCGDADIDADIKALDDMPYYALPTIAPRVIGRLAPLKKEISPMFIAIDNNDLKSVKEIFERTGDIENTDRSGETALMHAVNRTEANLEIVKFLVSKGANIWASNRSGENSICICSHNFSPISVEVLIFLLNNVYELYIPNSTIFNADFEPSPDEIAHNKMKFYKQIKYILQKHTEYINQKGQPNPKLAAAIHASLESSSEFIPKPVQAIIAGYAEQTFEEFLGNSYKDIN